MKKTVMVLSGGMDSVSLLHHLIKRNVPEGKKYGDYVAAISFNYGQKHSKELECAKANAAKFNLEHKVVDISVLQELLKGSSLTDNIEVPEGHYAGENMKLTVVPNRNSIMANIAIGWAVSLGFNEVSLGVHAGDHAIYPDCRPAFIKALAVLAEIANYEPIDIYTPYLYETKVGIIKDGLANGVDYSQTWTCYNGREKACGKCGSCQERLEAFAENGLVDPVPYEQ